MAMVQWARKSKTTTMATGDDNKDVDGDGATGSEVNDDGDGATGDDFDDDDDDDNGNDDDDDDDDRRRRLRRLKTTTMATA